MTTCAALGCKRRVGGAGFYFCREHTAIRLGGSRRARGAARDGDNVSGRLREAPVVPSAPPGGGRPGTSSPPEFSELELRYAWGDR